MVEQLSPRVVRLRAPNPSPMTFEGTNTYVVDAGDGALIAVDPGPALDAHRDALLAYAAGRGARYAAIIVTHGHPDHFPGAAPLAAATGAPVAAHPAARFSHDRTLEDGERLRVGALALRALHAPGHARDHLVFVLDEEGALFTGDVVVGRGTVVIAPPGGDMRAYQRTLARLRTDYGDALSLYGGHGPEVRDVRAKLDEYINHRALREAQVLAALAREPQTLPQLVEGIYRDVDRVLWPAAARQILAYLIALEAEGAVASERVDRPATAAEAAIIDPDLSKLGDGLGADVIRAELGYGDPQPLVRYALRTLP